MSTNKKSEAPVVRRRILIVDDHPIVRRGLAQLINGQKDLMVCGEAQSVAEAMTVFQRQRPDLAIVDLSLGSGDGIEVCREVQLRQPGLPILILSMHDEMLYAERVLRAGARGYVMKQEDAEILLQAIRKVLDGEVYLSEKMAARMVPSVDPQRSGASLAPTDCLSDRQLQIFRLIGQGIGVRQIALDLGLSPKTVEAHREQLKKKLKLASSSELVRYAIHQAMEKN